MGKLDGKVAVVVGGGGGIASGMTLALAKEGADIAVVERVAEKGEAVAREVEKTGVRVLATGVVAKEWGPDNINVNVVCPAAMTPGMKSFVENHKDPEFKKKAFGDRPINRLGDPEQDIGQVVAFLASAESDFMTGHTFWVDGGGSIHA